MADITRIVIGLSIMALATGLAFRRIAYLIRLLMTARPDPGRFRSVPRNLKYEFTKVIGQRKLLQWKLPGLAHAFTFWGFLIVQITLVETIGEMFSRHSPLFWHQQWLAFIEDTFAALVILRLITFAIIRVARSPRLLGRKSRFYSRHMWQAYVILFMIFMVVSTLLMGPASRPSPGT